MSNRKPWYWKRDGKDREWHLYDGRDRSRITVWPNGVWHTWDEHGVGGENGEEENPAKAFPHSVYALIRQGWAPWKVNYVE